MFVLKFNNRLGITIIAVLLIIFGVVIENSHDQVKKRFKYGDKFGLVLFILGWATLAYIIGKHLPKHKIHIYISCATIALSAISMKIMMKQIKKKIPLVLPALFIIGWLVFGWMMAQDRPYNSLYPYMKYIGFVPALIVLIVMLFIMPRQRTECNVDGPGLPLFTIALAMVVVVTNLNIEVGSK